MKKFLFLLSLAFVLLTLSCGGGGGGSSSGGGSSANSTPVISNLTVSPTQATLNQGGGGISVTLSLNFIDSGGDVSSWTFFTYDLNGNLITSSNTVQGVSGVTAGTITGPAILPTKTRGTFTVGMYITDAGGRQSNRLTTTFTIS